MVRHIENTPKRIQVIIIASRQTNQIKPAKFYGKYKFKQAGKEEGRQGDPGKREHRDRVIRLGILLCRCDNAKRDRYNQLQDQCDRTHHKGNADYLLKLLHNRNGEFPAITEVAAQHFAELHEKARDDADIHMVLGI